MKNIFFASLLLCSIAQAQYVHHGELTANGSLYFRAEPVNNFVPDKEGNIYYYVHLQGIDQSVTPVKKKHTPVNLSVVIDRSGSMEGDKLNYTKQAVKFLVNQLDPSDVLSIVLYDSDVQTFLEPQRVEDKLPLLKRIDDIVTAGSTNLEGGIKKGYELVNSAKKLVAQDMINRVLLLSDGLANVGLTDPAQLAAITRDHFEKEHISITTFGVGNDYNEDLMAKIALQGGGKYYFISSPEKLPSMFGEEMQGMSTVVAKNTLLKIIFPKDQLSYDRTYAYSSALSGNTLEVSFNDVFAKEQKSVLVAFKPNGKIKAPVSISCELSYDNSLRDSSLRIKDERHSLIGLAKDEIEYNSGFNRAASEGYVLEITAELYEKASQQCDAEHFDEARKTVRQAKDILETHFRNLGENIFLRDFEKKLTEYETLIENMKSMDHETVRLNIKFQKQKHFRTVSCPSF